MLLSQERDWHNLRLLCSARSVEHETNLAISTASARCVANDSSGVRRDPASPFPAVDPTFTVSGPRMENEMEKQMENEMEPVPKTLAHLHQVPSFSPVNGLPAACFSMVNSPATSGLKVSQRNRFT